MRAAVQKKDYACPVEPYVGYAQYRKGGGYKLIRDCLAGKRKRELFRQTRSMRWPNRDTRSAVGSHKAGALE